MTRTFVTYFIPACAKSSKNMYLFCIKKKENQQIIKKKKKPTVTTHQPKQYIAI